MIITFVIIFTILASLSNPRVIVKEVLTQGFFSLKFGRDTKVILPTPVCLFILYAAMAETNEIYVTIIGDLPVLLTPV